MLHALGKKSGGRDHLPWYVYYSADPHKFRTYFKFSFVRNPWDRCYSAFTYLSAGGNRTSDKPMADSLRRFESFDDFVVEGLGRGQYRSHLLFLPQANFIIGPNDEVMVDFLGRYETIDDDFMTISTKLGLKNELPHINANIAPRKNFYHDAYTCAESVEIIAEIYRQDILAFGYELGDDNGRYCR